MKKQYFLYALKRVLVIYASDQLKSLCHCQLKYLLILLFLVSSGNVFGQLFKKDKRPSENFGFHLKGNKKNVSIPFKVYSNLIVIPALIDDSDTLNFILDTGVSSIFITDPVMAEKMDMKYIRDISISGAGNQKSMLAHVSIGHEFKLGDVTGYQQNVVVLSEDILHLSEFLGIPIHGIFGHFLFENFIVTIDFNSLIINIRKPNSFKYREKKFGVKYPIIIANNKPYVDDFIIQDGEGVGKPVRLVIDTGAGHALLLNTEKGQIKLPEKVLRANLGRGLNGEIYGNIGRIPKVTIGEHEILDVIASFPDSLAFSMKFPPVDENRHGSIGGELLRRFKLTLNYHESYMALKANKKRLKQPFEHDMSGLDVRAFKDDLTRYYVKDVIPNSPSALAGMQANDEIIFINKEKAKKYDISDIYRMLSSKEGKSIQIIYHRNGAARFADFKLKRAI